MSQSRDSQPPGTGDTPYTRVAVSDAALRATALDMLDALPRDEWLTAEEWADRADIGLVTVYNNRDSVEPYIEIGDKPGAGKTAYLYRLSTDKIVLDLTE